MEDAVLGFTSSRYVPSDTSTVIRFTNSFGINSEGDGADGGHQRIMSVSPSNLSEITTTAGFYEYDNANVTGGVQCPNQSEELLLLRFSMSGVFLTIVCILGACSNLAAFAVLFSSKKFNQSVYIYMRCLAFNDFIMLTTFLMFALFALTFLPVTPPEIYLRANNSLMTIYKYWFALCLMCQGQSIWFMSLITLDRCFALSDNFEIREAVCRKRVAVILSSITVAIWFAFFVVNTFIHTSKPFCIYPDTGEQWMYLAHRTPFAEESWFFRVTFAIVMKFVLPVMLTVICISYSTAVLIKTISFSQPKASLSQSLSKGSKEGKQNKSKLVDTDERISGSEKAAYDKRESVHTPLSYQCSQVHGRNLKSRIQTAHALSWAIAAR